MRIDAYLVQNNFFSSRTKAKEAVERGEVTVNGRSVKPSYDVSDLDNVTVSEGVKFVSLGAYKLLRALEVFDFTLNGKVVADIGASTGGFTQCALNNGAKKVYSVDVGEGLLHPDLLKDERVVSIENTNARFLTKDVLGCEVDAVVADLSFISLTYILGGVLSVLKENGEAVLLIKPQFECGKKALSKNGIVTDPGDRISACKTVVEYATSIGLGCLAITNAPKREGKNIELLLHVKKSSSTVITEKEIVRACIN